MNEQDIAELRRVMGKAAAFQAEVDAILADAKKARIYDLRNNPLSTELLHARVYAWYARQGGDSPEMARWRRAQGLPRVRRERADAFLRSRGQRRSAR